LKNSDPVEIKFIKDPINNIALEKQVEKWNWICDTYFEKTGGYK